MGKKGKKGQRHRTSIQNLGSLPSSKPNFHTQHRQLLELQKKNSERLQDQHGPHLVQYSPHHSQNDGSTQQDFHDGLLSSQLDFHQRQRQLLALQKKNSERLQQQERERKIAAASKELAKIDKKLKGLAKKRSDLEPSRKALANILKGKTYEEVLANLYAKQGRARQGVIQNERMEEISRTGQAENIKEIEEFLNWLVEEAKKGGAKRSTRKKRRKTRSSRRRKRRSTRRK